MKSFLKNVLANIVAIILLLVFVFGILSFLAAIFSAGKDDKVSVADNSILTINLKTKIIDSETENSADLFSLENGERSVLIYDAIEAINRAKNDSKIKGISIEADDLNAGITQIDDLRAAIQDFKQSGKFVYAFGNTFSQPAYYLASVADKVYLHPAGGIDLKGLSAEVEYLKDFADKYGIGMQVIRHGKYKSAVEPFLRNDMSEENREQLQTLLNDVWENISSKITASRKIANQDFQLVVDSLYANIPEYSLQHKLVDQLAQKAEYENMLRGKLGVATNDGLERISLKKYIAANGSEKLTGKRIALLTASGEILNGEGYQNIHSEDFIDEVRELAEDDDVKAVVLRVNSPGGSANASDEILFELQQLKTKKPLVVSFGDYAASGGYYMSMGADKIYAEPNTLTGSIGVFGMIPYFKELANRNGINAVAVNTNANSNSYSPINGVTPQAVSMMTRSVEKTYQRFVYFVSKNRKKSAQDIDALGGGRVWSGTRAKEMGLVDELGTINDAIKFAAQKAKLSDYKVDVYPTKKTAWEQWMENFNSDEDDIASKLIAKKLGKDFIKIYQDLEIFSKKQEVYMKQMIRISF